MRQIRIICGFVLFFLVGCTDQPTKVAQEDIQVPVPRFNADSAYKFVAKQVDFGPRAMNTEGHEACKDWLAEQLSGFGFEVTQQEFGATSFKGEQLQGTNIVGRYKPEVLERVLLCAHWDTRPMADKDTIDRELPILGADDGGSGVGILLEIARQIQANPIPMGVDIVFFDAEDYGADQSNQDYTWGLGSQYWSKNLPDEDYQVKYGILLDMVGAKGASFPKEGFSRKSAQVVVNKVWELANRMGKSKFFPKRIIPPITDDHRFIIENASIPMVDIIHVNAQGRFGQYHHTHRDNMDIIDTETLDAVGQVVLAVIYNQSNKTFL